MSMDECTAANGIAAHCDIDKHTHKVADLQGTTSTTEGRNGNVLARLAATGIKQMFLWA